MTSSISCPESAESLHHADYDGTTTGSTLKILVALASHGTKNQAYLERVLGEYRSMRHTVRKVVLSNVPRMLGADVEVRVGLPDKDPWSLPFGHKQLFADHVNDFDVFIYAEDDVLISERNIDAFVAASKVLPEHFIPGFVHAETDEQGSLHYDPIHSHFHWEPGSLFLLGDQRFAYYSNEHSACFLLTQKQLKKAIASGGFLVRPYEGRYDMLCAAATDPYTRCGFKKMVCISHLDDFTVLHLPNNKYAVRPYRAKAVFDRQVERLIEVQQKRMPAELLFNPETKVLNAKWSKDYYEAVRTEVLAMVPQNAHEVLSIGCAWSSTEEELIKRGHKVTGIPMDSVIAACAEDKALQVVYGGFQASRQKLEERHFDSILLLNVLHLLPDPAGVLSSFVELLNRGGQVVIADPNFASIPTYWRRLCGDRFHKDLGSFEKTGIQLTSPGQTRRWLKDCNLKPAAAWECLPERAQSFRNFIPRLLRSAVASEFVISAIKE